MNVSVTFEGNNKKCVQFLSVPLFFQIAIVSAACAAHEFYDNYYKGK